MIRPPYVTVATNNKNNNHNNNNKSNNSSNNNDNRYIHHHFEGNAELAVMMLRAWAHTGDEVLLRDTVLPWCESLLRFYDEHYPK